MGVPLTANRSLGASVRLVTEDRTSPGFNVFQMSSRSGKDSYAERAQGKHSDTHRHSTLRLTFHSPRSRLLV